MFLLSISLPDKASRMNKRILLQLKQEMTDSTFRLRGENLTLGYGKKIIARDLSVSIPDGHFTAIIGPNGCGKSNIVDAIRWVIGEHKIKTLRSDNLEDLIFNGSKTRNGSGLAEVTPVSRKRLVISFNRQVTSLSRYSLSPFL